jgi:hypothetical protein
MTSKYVYWSQRAWGEVLDAIKMLDTYRKLYQEPGTRYTGSKSLRLVACDRLANALMTYYGRENG